MKITRSQLLLLLLALLVSLFYLARILYDAL